MKIERSGDWISAQVGDELVMMSAEHGRYLGLSPIGARIWDLLDTPTTLDQVVDKLTSDFNVSPQQCRDDTLAFIEELASHGAVAIDPPPAA